MKDKSKEQYIKELEDLQKEHNSLKATVEKELCIKKEEESILRKLILSSEEFIQFTDNAPDYNKILQVILDISGAKYAALNVFDENGLDFTTVAFTGIRENIKKGLSFLGFDVLNKHWNHDPIRAEKTKPQNITRFMHLDELTGDVIPKSIIFLLEKTFHIDETYIVKVVKDNKVLGDFTLIFEKGKTLKNKSYVELYSNQVGLFLDRKKSQQALAKSEEKLLNIFENTSSVFYSHTPKHLLTYLSPQVKDMLGYTQEEALIKWTELVSDNPINKIGFQHTVKAIKTGKRQPLYNLELVKKNGEIIWVELRETPVLNNGKVVSIVGSLTDVTEQINTEKELAESEKRFKSIVNESAFPIAIADISDEKILYWSRSTKKMFGHSPKTVSEWFKLAYPDTEYRKKVFEQWEPHVKKAIETKRTINSGEYKITCKDGSVKVCHIYVQKISNNLVVTFHDITDTKKAEKELIQLNADKNRFISILGHDLRSPFNNLLGFSDLLAENIHDYDIDKIEEFVKIINYSARNTHELLNDLLVWASSQQGKIPFKPQSLSLTDVCNDVLRNINPTANEKNIAINFLAKDHLNVFADIDMLKTVLRNLVSNAIKFTNLGGLIDISGEQTDSNVTISVSDNGIGIKPDNLAKLFDISEVVTTKGTADESGTGLGLLLCKEFVEKHGGKIWVESEVGKGTEIIFTLPCRLS